MTGQRQVLLSSGRELSARVVGQGRPVVLLAGFMAGASEWSAVQRELQDHARTISYDRAGYGSSSDSAAPLSADAAMTDLLELLDALAVDAPAVFVAHSWGGALLRLLLHEHPERVAAAVFVDATRADLLSTSQLRAQSASLRLMARLSFLGLHRRLMTKALNSKVGGLNEVERVEFLADSTSARSLPTGVRENAAMIDDLRLLTALEEAGLPDVPVCFIVGAKADAGARRTRSRMLAGHEQEATSHPRGRFVIAPDSGHMVPQQQPDLVAREILDLIGGTSCA